MNILNRTLEWSHCLRAALLYSFSTRKKPFDFPHRCDSKRKTKGENQCVMPNWHRVLLLLGNLLVLFVSRGKSQFLKLSSEAKTLRIKPCSYHWPLPGQAFPREDFPAPQWAFTSLTGLLLCPSAHLYQILSDLTSAWSAR